ncbi:hypothetical protein GGI07_003318 [Coemansia sp. Benny D115]|nr:hypothetical protein GGI07_003318 [Coemansia sp. Benny D115]
MSQEASVFLEAVNQLPSREFPATRSTHSALSKVCAILEPRLPPHLRPLLTRLHAFVVRQAFSLEKRLHVNPTFKLLLGLRIVPPGLAFIAAAASTVYAVRYLYTYALDLLTNIIGVAYPAYQSILAIEYGDRVVPRKTQQSSSWESALGLAEPNLNKKQWLMYWAIYGALTTADHWAGSILRLFPMYRVAKIGVLVWAQHAKYNGAEWLYDSCVKPLLPPADVFLQQQSRESGPRSPENRLASGGGRFDALVDSQEDDESACVAGEAESALLPPPPFSSIAMPSVWESAKSSVGGGGSLPRYKDPTGLLLSGPA